MYHVIRRPALAPTWLVRTIMHLAIALVFYPFPLLQLHDMLVLFPSYMLGVDKRYETIQSKLATINDRHLELEEGRSKTC